MSSELIKQEVDNYVSKYIIAEATSEINFEGIRALA